MIGFYSPPAQKLGFSKKLDFYANIKSMWPYQTVGFRHNPPLLFLHGFLGSGDDWRPIARQFAADFYCLLPDLPGHGRFAPPIPPATPLTFAGLADDLIHWLDELQLAKVHLVGYSMGGRVGLFTAVHHPHRFASLVLEGASPGLNDEQARQERARLDDERAADLLTVGIETFVTQWYEMALFRTLKQQPTLLARTLEKRKQNNGRWMAKVISDLSPGRQPPLWNHLAHLPLPVLLLAGDLDPTYSQLIQQMQSLMPQAVAKTIPHSGHNVHLENPQQFVQLLNTFLHQT